MKNLLIYYFDKLFSPCLEAYRQGYKAKYVLVHLKEEWSEEMGNGCVVGAVLNLAPRAIFRLTLVVKRWTGDKVSLFLWIYQKHLIA